MPDFKSTSFYRYIKEKANPNFFIFLGLAGLILISLGDSLPKYSKEKQSDPYDPRAYRESIEEKLENILSKVDGAGRVEVMVTLESGRENVYVSQEKTSDDRQTASADITGGQSVRSTYENEIVLVSDAGGKSALVEKTLAPAVQGVVVVCSGAGDVKVVSDVTNAVAVALNLPSNRVCVIKMK